MITPWRRRRRKTYGRDAYRTGLGPRALWTEVLEDRRMLHVLSTGSGDGSVTVDVDGYGSFGSAVFLLGSQGAVYDPIGPIGPASTTFQSGVAVRLGTIGERQFLTSGDILGSGGLEAPVVTGDLTQATSTYTASNLETVLTQTVSPLLNADNVQTGSILVQSYAITNIGSAAVDLEVVRYIDGDLLFDGTLVDGGGRLLLPAEFLFETDAGGSGATDTTFLGIDATGGTIPTVGRFEVDSFAGLGTRIIEGAALDDIITGDSDGDGFVDAGAEYDITLAFRNIISLAPGESGTYVTRTVFGSGAPEDIPVNDPKITVEDIAQLEGNSGLTNFVFHIELIESTSEPVIVTYATEDDTATSPGDYLSQTGTVTFLPGGPESLSITIPVVGDAVVEPDESFRVLFTDMVGGGSTESTAVATILNDDVELSIGDVTLVEGNGGTKDAVFTILAQGGVNTFVSINYTTVSNTAVAPGDFTAKSGVVHLMPGSSSATIRVPVVGDNLNEDTETFWVVLTSAQGARINRSTGVATILDDDPLPNLYVSDVVVTTTGAGSYTAEFAVALDRASGRRVSVEYTTDDGTATAGVQYEARSGVVVFEPGQNTRIVSVPVMTDGVFAENRNFYFNLTLATHARTIDPQGRATIVYAPDTLGEYIMDDNDAGYSKTGNWTNVTNTLAYHLDYEYAPAGNGNSTATWNFVGIPNASYEVFARWSAFGNRATNAPFTMLDDGVPVGTVSVNQQLPPTGEYSDGIYWQSLGTFPTTTNNFAVRLTNNANGYVVADAVRIVAGGIAPQEPEMDVAGLYRSIITGDTSPTTNDGTDFGFVPQWTDSSVHTFEITNNGNADLHLTGVPRVSVLGQHASDFLVMSQPDSVVMPGRSTSFDVLFQPGGTGLRTAMLSIANTDDTEHPYVFMVQGTGVGPAPLAHNAALPQDVNGDERVSARDALILINHLLTPQTASPQAAVAEAADLQVAAEPVYYVDVNHDGRVSAVDALMVINYLLSGPQQSQQTAAPATAEPLAAAEVDNAIVLLDDTGDASEEPRQRVEPVAQPVVDVRTAKERSAALLTAQRVEAAMAAPQGEGESEESEFDSELPEL